MSETNLPVGGAYFSSVKKARAALAANAERTYEKLLKVIDMAAAAGDFETAAKYAWMLLAHAPKEDGQTVIDTDASKAPSQLDSGPKGPIIQIGVKVGGVNEPKELPEVVAIDVKPEQPN